MEFYLQTLAYVWQITGRVTVGSQKAKKPPLLFEQGLPVSKNICQQEGGGGQLPPPTVQRRPDSGD